MMRLQQRQTGHLQDRPCRYRETSRARMARMEERSHTVGHILWYAKSAFAKIYGTFNKLPQPLNKMSNGKVHPSIIEYIQMYRLPFIKTNAYNIIFAQL